MVSKYFRGKQSISRDNLQVEIKTPLPLDLEERI